MIHLGFRLLDAGRPGRGRKHSMYIRGSHQHQDRDADRMPDFLAVPEPPSKAVADSMWKHVRRYDDDR